VRSGPPGDKSPELLDPLRKSRRGIVEQIGLPDNIGYVPHLPFVQYFLKEPADKSLVSLIGYGISSP
jgi:hypothetical protein